MAKRKQYIELVAHPKLTSAEFHHCRQHKKLFDILSAYATALSHDVPDVCVTEVIQRLAGAVLKITLGTSQGLHLMRIDYAIVNGECLVLAIALLSRLFVESSLSLLAIHIYCLRLLRWGHNYVISHSLLLSLLISVRDRIGEISTYVSGLCVILRFQLTTS